MSLPPDHRHADPPAPYPAGTAPPMLAGGYQWLRTGARALAKMLEAIDEAQASIRLEMYTIQPGVLGEKFREQLTAAAQRGVRVWVLADAVGSMGLSKDFWQPLMAAGGECRYFNLPGRSRFGLRDHRKLMVCDDNLAFVGGVNIGPEYLGDGVTAGWRDLAVQFHGALARELAGAFDEMFAHADFKHPRFAWLRHAIRQRHVDVGHATALLIAPGWRRNPMVRTLTHDFKTAESIRIMAAYFLPTVRVLHALRRAARRGTKVQLILAGHSDVPHMRMAARSLYHRLLKCGVEIYEYQPQILHAKMIIVNENIVYAGSANLDVRSLHLNYELLLRVEHQRLAREAGEIFADDLAHCHRVEIDAWLKTRHWWRRLLDHCAYFLAAHIDPFLSSFSWRR